MKLFIKSQMDTIEFLAKLLAEFLCLLHTLCDIHLRQDWPCRRCRNTLIGNHHIDRIACSLLYLDIDTRRQLAVKPFSMGRKKRIAIYG